MNVIHVLAICVVTTQVCVGYEMINSEIIERINLDNTQELQEISNLAKPLSQKTKNNAEGKSQTPEDTNLIQNVFDNAGLITPQQNVIYTALHNIPIVLSNKNKPTVEEINKEKTKLKSLTIIEEKQQQEQTTTNTITKNNKYEDPKEDKTQDVKSKLYSHLKQTLPKLYSILNVEVNKKINEEGIKTNENIDGLKNDMKVNDNVQIIPQNNDQVEIIDTEIMKKSKQKMKNIFKPYFIIEQPNEFEFEHQNANNEDQTLNSEENYPAIPYDDKIEFKHKKGIKKTVKTHKTGEEKKNIYPKEDIKKEIGIENVKDDMETDNTIWIGYGLGIPTYKYPYNYEPSLYNRYYNYYGSPYSGWTNRGYQEANPYENYYDRVGLSAYNNYGTGYGPYGRY